MARPAPPPTLIYDYSNDGEELLPGRLEGRWREGANLNMIVRLKSGSTLVGRLCYFDSSRMTLTKEGRLWDLMYSDIAHILSATPLL